MLQLNTTSLYQIMQDFYTLTKIRIVIFDSDFRGLLAYPQNREDFCQLLRQTPDGDAVCKASDINGCLLCAKTKELVSYRCHAGLTEVVVPIIDKGNVLAYVMFGQIIPSENGTAIKKQIKRRFPQYHAEIEKIPAKTSQELSAAATILQAITAYMMTNRWIVPSKSEFIRQLDHYIEDHLSQNISVDDICVAFHVGRTKLYKISMDYLGCGLAEYIRTQRIRHAQKLLAKTNLSITEIASAVGLSDYNHFSRLFKKVAGISAREYRRRETGNNLS